MFLSVELDFRRPIYPPFYSFAKIFQILSNDSLRLCRQTARPAAAPEQVPINPRATVVQGFFRLFTRLKSPLMNAVRFTSDVCLLPSDKDEDACRQRQYACNYSRDGESEDGREADHDQINGEQEHSDVFGEDEVH